MHKTGDTLHVCWKSAARGAPDNWIRLKSSIDSTFVMRVLEVDNPTMMALPELEEFDPPYGTTLATENTTEIKFSFHSDEVYPAEHATHGLGILRIYRGAVRDDGTIDIAVAAPVLWEDAALNDTAAVDKFKQGDIECSTSGKCLVHLSEDSKLTPGEIYYLTFYPYSFKNSEGYYLFGETATPGVPMYEHMFQCRSFNVYDSDQTINGNYFKMSGVNLLSNEAYAKMNGNDILKATFKTKALKVALRITNSTSCASTLIPSASIKLKDMTETSFEVFNLNLRNCYQGDVYADFTIIRGIKEKAGVWTHERREYLKDVKIGTIACHSSCTVCSGPASNQCLLCADLTKYLSDGSCISSCPSSKPYVQTSTFLYNAVTVTYNYCTSD